MKRTEHSTSNTGRRMGAPAHPDWMLDVGCWVLGVPKFILIFAIHIYRWTISPALIFLSGPASGCRFTPSCSQYAMEAIRSRGVLAGGWLAVKRICRCHPWGNCGHDPAPQKEFGVRNSEFGI